MRASIIVFILLTTALTSYAQAADALYHREVNEKNPGGIDLKMNVQELSRDEKTSTVKVTTVSGSPMPTIMVISRAFYDIARARGAKYFCNLKEWDDKKGARMYLVGFSNDKNVNLIKYFKLTEPLSKPDDNDTNDHEFLSVKDFDLIFKGEK